MRGGPTSAAEEDKQVSGSDSKLRATNAAKQTQCPSSLRRAGRSYAAIALARIAQPNGTDELMPARAAGI